MFLIIRTITYASLFTGLVLIYLPGHLLSWSGIIYPTEIKLFQVAGIAIGSIGAVISLLCILTFISIGRGTPAHFDPPHKLVMKGPYRYVRNPLYIGAILALLGAALFYESILIVGYAIIFFFVAHIFVVLCEEPTLQKTFGKEYETYCLLVKRWLPRR